MRAIAVVIIETPEEYNVCPQELTASIEGKLNNTRVRAGRRLAHRIGASMTKGKESERKLREKYLALTVVR